MELIRNEYPFGDFEELNRERKKLLANTQTIHVTDLGAGSKKLSSNTRKISNIVEHGIAPKKQAEFLYRLLNKFQPKVIVELGTSVGLTTLYLAKACPKSKVYTIEGCPNLYEFSKKIIETNGVNNVHSIQGNFNTELPKLIETLDSLDFFYIDGNHTYEATMHYFNLALTNKNTSSIFVFDDINWSEGMQKAWQEICSHNEVTLSLDFFSFGIVFFRLENKQKEHYILRF